MKKFRFVLIPLLLVIACAHGPSPAPSASTTTDARLSILQGFTDERSTQLTIVVPKGSHSVFELIDGEQRITPKRQKVISREDSAWAVARVAFSGLKKNHSYEFVVKDPEGVVIDRRELSTLDLSKKNIHFGVASCMDDTYLQERVTMWIELLEQKPELLFLIGDNVYADKDVGFYKGPAEPSLVWKRYTDTRLSLELFKTKRLVPILATWDDHDYGVNDGDRTYKQKDESRKIFETFFAQEPTAPSWIRGPGVSSRLSAFGQVFYLLDDRTHRSPKGHADQTHWGKEQERWLLQGLSASSAPAWLMNGDQYFGGYAEFESYEGHHPKSFKQMLQSLGKVKAPVFFISGDRHLLELMKIPSDRLGYETYELTTSAIHAKVFPSYWDKTPNPLQIEGVANTHNYVIIDSHTEKGQLLAHLRAYGPAKRVLFDRELVVARK